VINVDMGISILLTTIQNSREEHENRKEFGVFWMHGVQLRHGCRWKDDLERIGTDQKNWRHFYRDMEGNVYIQFYPYSEHHGGGQPYMIDMKGNDRGSWRRKHPHFENEIRKELDRNR
jgi:hypothetical protein